MRHTIALAAVLLCTTPVHASGWHSPMIVDSNFTGVVPQLDATHPLIAPIGFVHLPISGGYFMFTEQPVGSANKIAVTKFTEGGVIDGSWPPAHGGGTWALPLPPPDVDFSTINAQARVVVDVSLGVEDIYIFERYYACGSDGCLQYLFTSVMNSAGSIIANSAMPMDSFPTYPWTFSAAMGGVALGGGATGAVIAAQATGTSVTELVAAHRNPPSTFPPLVVYGFSEVSGSGARVNGMTPSASGGLTTFGTEASLAVFGTVLFPLTCPTSTPLHSVLDGAVDAQTGSDVIVEGRVDCGSDGMFSEIARVSNIDNPGTVSVVSASLMEPLTTCATDFATSGCTSAYLIAPKAAPPVALATTPTGALAHANVDAPEAFFTGADIMPDASVFATSRYGAYYNFPYLTGMTLNVAPSGNTVIGIGRFVADRIAANGFQN